MIQRVQLPDGSTWEERTTYTARGLPRTEIVIKHRHLGMVRVIRDASRYVAAEKAAAQIQVWDAKWQGQRYIIESEAGAARQTEAAQAALHALQGILHSSLSATHRVEWSELGMPFPESRPPEPKLKTEPERPARPQKPTSEPSRRDIQYRPGLLGVLLPGFRAGARERFEADHAKWEASVLAYRRHPTLLEEWEQRSEQIREENERLRAAWEKDVASWENRKTQHEGDEKARVDTFKQDVAQGQRSAVEEFFSVVLERSDYPECFPHEFAVAFDPEPKILVCDYQLPSPGALPTLKEVVYVKTKGTLTEKQLGKKDSETLYDSVVYQTCIRTVHELWLQTSSSCSIL